MEANSRAKAAGLSNTLASINISLITIGLQEGNYYEAEKYLKEGQRYVNQTQDERLQIDYEHSAYELERAKKNYKKALQHLSSVYSKDSLNYNKQISQKIALIEIQHNLWKREQESIQLQKEKKFSQQLNWAFVAVIVLTIVSIITLVSLIRKKNKTNEQLSLLNNEISSKKEALDKINKHLEDIIEDRTKDLQIKNKKLSDYSSHLSHEIRGPVAASKGLLALKKDQLIDDDEFIAGVTNCVEDIDMKIHKINKDLHDPQKGSFQD